MDSPAGIVVLAVVGLWVAYLVPHRLRQRQELLESRVNDRFSGSLRVLAVATANGAPETRPATRWATKTIAHHSHGDCSSSSNPAAPLLTPPHGTTAGHQQHHTEGEQDMEQPHHPVSQSLPVREALHERRAAAARRRALLTAALLVVSVVAGALAGFSIISPWVVVAPGALLASVLVLGRRAVIGNQRADAVWAERERARQAARATAGPAAPGAGRGPSGRPAPAVRPPVTGRAVHASQSHTQVITRVRPSQAASADDGPAPVAQRSASEGATAPRTGGPRAVADTTADAREHEAGDLLVAVDDREHAPGATEEDNEWQPVPVPRPVYTMKSAAPRWEPAPLTAELQQVTEARRAQLAEDHATAGAAATAEPAAEADGSPGVDSLGVNLNSVLARRRAAGE